MSRCKRPMPGMFCGLPEGNHWPHRYIERQLPARLLHEWRLRRYGYTSWSAMALAMLGWAR